MPGPPGASNAETNISFVQVNSNFVRREMPLVRVGENDEIQFSNFTNFFTFAAPGLAVNSGKWFYEIKVESDTLSAPQFGWVDPAHFDPASRHMGTGDCQYSYAIDATRTCYYHKRKMDWNGAPGHDYSRFKFTKGAIITCSVDLKTAQEGGFGSLFFHVNGTPCPTPPLPFRKIKAGTFLLPAITMSRGSVRVR